MVGGHSRAADPFSTLGGREPGSVALFFPGWHPPSLLAASSNRGCRDEPQGLLKTLPALRLARGSQMLRQSARGLTA